MPQLSATSARPLAAPSVPGRSRRSVAAALRVERVVGVAALAALREEWLELWRRSGTSPFQAPGAVLAWARSHAPDRIAAIVVRDHGLMVAVAPIFAWRGTLLLAGTGPTDYGDVLVENERPELADLLLRELACLAESRGLPRIDLQQLRSNSLLLSAGVPQGWRQARLPGKTCPVAPVLGSDGLAGVPPRRRRKFEAARRRAERDGPEARFVTARDEEVAHLGEELFRLHSARWRSKGEAGVLAEPLMQNFVRQLLPELREDGVLRLHALVLDGKIAAVLLAMHERNAAHLYLSGFDTDQERWRPGARLLAYAFQAAADEGLREMHFLRGREAYKYDWGAEDRQIWRRELTLLDA